MLVKAILRPLLFLTCLLTSPSYALDFTETVECDVKFMDLALTYIEQSCPPPDSGKDWYVCGREVYEKTIPHLCSPMAKKHFQNQLFFYEEYLIVIGLIREKKLSLSEYQKKMKRIDQLSAQEIKDYYRQYNSIIEKQKNISANRVAELQASSNAIAMDILRADNYRTNAIFMGIAILNGPSLYQSSVPRVETYSINGRFITCTTMSGFTNCN